MPAATDNRNPAPRRERQTKTKRTNVAHTDGRAAARPYLVRGRAAASPCQEALSPEVRSWPGRGCDASSQKGAGDALVASYGGDYTAAEKNATVASLSPCGDEASPPPATGNPGRASVLVFQCKQSGKPNSVRPGRHERLWRACGAVEGQGSRKEHGFSEHLRQALTRSNPVGRRCVAAAGRAAARPCREALSRIHAPARHTMRGPACVGQASRLSPSKKIPHLLMTDGQAGKTTPQGDPSKLETGATPVLRHGSGLGKAALLRRRIVLRSGCEARCMPIRSRTRGSASLPRVRNKNPAPKMERGKRKPN